MKTASFLLLALFGTLLFTMGQFSIAPTDLQASVVWNLGLVLAPILAIFFQWRIAKERRIPIAIFLTVWAVINSALVLGSRAGAWTANDWYQVLIGNGLPALPGKTVLGGLLLAIVVFAILHRWWRISFHVADALVIGLPLAGITARIGCLYAGCCYGLPTGAENGICYGPGTPAFTQQMNAGMLAADASSSLPVYPIQLILVIGNLLIFGVLWHFRKKLTRAGALSFLGLTLLTMQRFGIEFFRDTVTNRGQFGVIWEGLKMAQWACLFMATIGVIGFIWVQSGKAQVAHRRGSASIMQQAVVIGCIAIGVLLLQSVLTLDETMMILVSCLPAIYVLGRLLWRERLTGQKVLIPTLMLSATTLNLFVSPLDTIAPPVTNRQWLEIGAGGAIGNYQHIARDCNGNVTSRDVIKYNAGGLDIASNWQRDDVFFKAGIRGAFGSARPQDILPRDDYRYTSFGLYGGISYRWIGFSLGGFSRQQIFTYGDKEDKFLASGSLRLGLVSKYSFDIRVFDEPAFSFSNEPIFSMGLVNWGFNDPSGSTFLRAGFAATNEGETAFHLSGGFPFGNSGVRGTIATYLGNANMVHVGLRYRFKETTRY